jgi:hypothetical protein
MERYFVLWFFIMPQAGMSNPLPRSGTGKTKRHPAGLEAGLNQRRSTDEKNKGLNRGFAALLYD